MPLEQDESGQFSTTLHRGVARGDVSTETYLILSRQALNERTDPA